MMNKLIATGYLVKSENLIVTASVYANLDEAGKELSEPGDRYAILKMTNRNAEALATDALGYNDIMNTSHEESGDAEPITVENSVPGFNGHDDVELSAPVSITYSKTKSFLNKEGKPQVYAQMRFTF